MSLISTLPEMDAARGLAPSVPQKACRSHARCWMATAGQHKHALMVTYGQAALAGLFTEIELDGPEIIRRLRNIADYDGPTPPSVEQLRALIAFAKRIHDAWVISLPTSRISIR